MTAKKEAPIGTLFAFWSYGDYPYFCCGEVTRMHESGMVETKEYGPGSTVRPVLLVPLNTGRRLKDKLKMLEQDHRKALSELKRQFEQALIDTVPELAETRKR